MHTWHHQSPCLVLERRTRLRVEPGIQEEQCGFGLRSCVHFAQSDLFPEHTSVNCSSWMTHCVSYASYGFNSSLSLSYSSIYKGCAALDQCLFTGIDQGSVNYGTGHRFLNKQCCDTDNCNTANSSIPAPSAGSLQCYGCDSSECTTNVTCLSGESCFQTTQNLYGSQYSAYGCISENQCNRNNSLFFPGSNPVTCCNTSHCNKPDKTLQCLKCTDESCSSQTSVTCSSSYCYSYHYASSYSTSTYNYTYNGCGESWRCSAAGSKVTSYIYGSTSYYYNTTCCNTSDCNAPNLSAPSTGSLQCYSCDPGSYDCTSKVTCRDQELCFQTNNTSSKTIHGCVSESLCFDYYQSQRYFNEPLSCCNTSLCNGPEITLPTDDSIFSGSEQMVAPALLLSLLLLLCSHG
ncbi:hypothetical protein WMY93_028327 [Mugilogobius chulae]|uniref:UPAR/Ly6 domain-containing protein n=1 Tax=Mugilogobius chulae TaxID=88201 RepID=A0AAW0N088_9GOBI